MLDSLLKWPFTHSVTFTLFEQGPMGGQGGVVESFVSDPSWENFVKDDTVFLRVKVDPSKIVAV
jgi:TNF receptor-associated factor 4